MGVFKETPPDMAQRYKDGESLEALAYAYGMTPTTVRTKLLQQNVQLRGVPTANPISDLAVEQYLNGESVTALAKAYRTSWVKMRTFLEEHGVNVI